MITLELTKEEFNVLRNGISLVLAQNEDELSPSAEYWYLKVMNKLDEIANQKVH
jgi:hypothetical protein